MNLAGVAGLFLVKAAVVWALSDVPTNENFIARAQVTATVLGNFVYIDGGRVWQIDPDPVLNGFIFAMNSTISIDLTKTWTSRSVALRTIPKPPEIASRCKGHVWTDTGSNGSFYSWGGYWGVAARERVDETPRLYKFTADGNGGGNWSIVPSEEISPFGVLDTLHPAEAGAFATTSDGVGFVIGGKATPWTEKSRQRLEINGTRAHQMVPGMLSFDIKTKTFHNTSSSPALSGETNEHNAIISAVAHYVPGYGKNGVIVLLGGVASPVDKDVDAKFSEPIGFRNLTFFDPVTKESFWQMTSGEEPESPRTFFCAVGFDAGDGRYDILFFGGQNEERDLYYADAWVLSLPGFVWTRLENIPDEWAPGGRGMHSCVRVGKRQVLIIGGLFKSDRDPVPQGLLLFDHMSGGYGLRYEPNDEPYQSPSNVKAFYEKGNLSNVQWSSDRVQSMFLRTAVFEPTPSVSTVAPETTSGLSSPDNPSESVVLPAAVGGSLGGLAMIVTVGIWMVWRRRRDQARQQKKINSISTVYEHIVIRPELQGQAVSEMPAHFRYVAGPPLCNEIDNNGHGYAELSSVPER